MATETVVRHTALYAALDALCRELGVSHRHLYGSVMSRQMYYAALNGTRSLSPEMFDAFHRKLQNVLDEWVAREFKSEHGDTHRPERRVPWRALQERLTPVANELVMRVPFVRLGPSGRPLIDPAQLVGLSAQLVREIRVAERIDDERVRVLRSNQKQVVVVVEGDLATYSDEALGRTVKALAARANAPAAGPFRAVAVRPDACIEIVLELSDAQEEQLHAAFARGDLAELGVIGVYGTSHRASDVATRLLTVETPVVTSVTDDPDSVIESSARRLLRRAKTIRPWRQLRWMVSPSVSQSILAHCIRESEDRAYVTNDLFPLHRGVLRADLTTSWVVWPVLTATLLSLSLSALNLLEPSVVVGLGVTTGLVLSLVGGQVCASVVSPLAVGAASIILGWVFGVVNGVVIGRFDATLSAESIRADPFTTVTGGIVGLSAPEWPGALGWAGAAVILMTIAVGISATGWLMAQPHNFKTARKRTPGRDAIAVAAGALMGGGIGLVLALSRWLASLGFDRAMAFIAAFCVIGVPTFAMLVWVRSKSAKRTAAFALCHGFIWIVLCWTAFHTSALLAVVALTAANAWYHATWFTAAFLVARTIGSRRAAVAAAAIEGAGGFIGFAAWRMISG